MILIFQLFNILSVSLFEMANKKQPGPPDSIYTDFNYQEIIIERREKSIWYYGKTKKDTYLAGYIDIKGIGEESITIKENNEMITTFKFKTSLTKETYRSDYFTTTSIECLNREMIG